MDHIPRQKQGPLYAKSSQAATAAAVADRAQEGNSRRDRALWSIARGLQPGLVNRQVLLMAAAVAAQTMMIAEYHPNAARAVLVHSSPLALLMSFMSNLTPLLLTSVVIWYGVKAATELASWRDAQAWRSLARAALAVAVGSTLVDHSSLPSLAWIFFALLAMVVISVGIRALPTDLTKIDELGAIVLLSAAAVILAVAATSPEVRNALTRPPQPFEVIQVRGEEIGGYVLSVDRHWTTILTDARTVIITPNTDIRHRRICGETPLKPVYPLVSQSHNRPTIEADC